MAGEPFHSEHGHRSVDKVFFLRTNIATNPIDEIRSIVALQRAVDTASHAARRRVSSAAGSVGALDHRVVLCVHGSFKETEPVCRVNDRAVVWRLAYEEGGEEGQGTTETKGSSVLNATHTAGGAHNATRQRKQPRSLFDRTQSGYAKVVQACETNWDGVLAAAEAFEAKQQQQHAPWPRSDHLAKVSGVPAFRGTCVGFGSTVTESLGGLCPHCGDATGHAMENPQQFDSAEPWGEADDAAIFERLISSSALGHGIDIVALVESVANERKRGAHETLRRCQALIGDNFLSPQHSR